MTPPFLIRALTTEDLPQVRARMQAPEAPRWSRADLMLAVESGAIDTGRARTGRERRGWALLDGRGQIAGFLIATALHVAEGAAECELEFVFVAPQLRGSGAGRALLERWIAWADGLGASEIWLEVRAANAAARRLYVACGFAEAGVRPGYYLDPPDDAVLMRRRSSLPGHDANV